MCHPVKAIRNNSNNCKLCFMDLGAFKLSKTRAFVSLNRKLKVELRTLSPNSYKLSLDTLKKFYCKREPFQFIGLPDL